MSAVVEKRPPPSVARGSFDDRADERAAGHSLAARINHSLKERARRVWGRGGHCGGARGHSCPPAIVQRGLKDGALKRERRSLVERKEGVDGLCHGVFLGFPSSLDASPPPVLAERRAVNGKLF